MSTKVPPVPTLKLTTGAKAKAPAKKRGRPPAQPGANKRAKTTAKGGSGAVAGAGGSSTTGTGSGGKGGAGKPRKVTNRASVHEKTLKEKYKTLTALCKSKTLGVHPLSGGLVSMEEYRAVKEALAKEEDDAEVPPALAKMEVDSTAGNGAAGAAGAAAKKSVVVKKEPSKEKKAGGKGGKGGKSKKSGDGNDSNDSDLDVAGVAENDSDYEPESNPVLAAVSKKAAATRRAARANARAVGTPLSTVPASEEVKKEVAEMMNALHSRKRRHKMPQAKAKAVEGGADKDKDKVEGKGESSGKKPSQDFEALLDKTEERAAEAAKAAEENKLRMDRAKALLAKRTGSKADDEGLGDASGISGVKRPSIKRRARLGSRPEDSSSGRRSRSSLDDPESPTLPPPQVNADDDDDHDGGEQEGGSPVHKPSAAGAGDDENAQEGGSEAATATTKTTDTIPTNNDKKDNLEEGDLGWSSVGVDPTSETDPCSVYVADLTEDVTSAVLEEAFSRFGPVDSVRVMPGYGFVTFAEANHAQEAILSMNKQQVGTATIRTAPAVRKARDTHSRQPHPEAEKPAEASATSTSMGMGSMEDSAMGGADGGGGAGGRRITSYDDI